MTEEVTDILLKMQSPISDKLSKLYTLKNNEITKKDIQDFQRCCKEYYALDKAMGNDYVADTFKDNFIEGMSGHPNALYTPITQRAFPEWAKLAEEVFLSED